MTDSHELYQEMILHHSRQPRHYGKLESHTHVAEGDNPLCGDHYHVYLSVTPDGVISDASFEGSGCAISKASSSLMTDAIIGKSRDDVLQLFEQFRDLVTNGNEKPLGKLGAFAGIWKYPSRVKCAILCWHAVRSALCDGTTVSTEA
jgi:nitrogen fixation NifU-like protein